MGSLVDETYISVDIEASGPAPSVYSLLSIGACVAFDPAQTFYVELQPVTDAFTDEAMAVGGLDLERLRTEGVAPREAMVRFDEWVRAVTPVGRRPMFVAFNAAFDWMFVADYFHRFLGHNPFGHKALDIKALYMGAVAARWDETSFRHLATHYRVEQQVLSHNALEDAVAQAGLFRRVVTVLEDREPEQRTS
jgi:DNA polymerase III epsilon subunit-like protein